MLVDFNFFGKVEKPMIALIIALLIVVATFNWQVAFLCAILVVAVLAFLGHGAKKRRDDLTEYLETMTANMEQTTHFALQNLPMAIAIIDGNANICWSNSVFKDWMGSETLKTQRIQGLSSLFRVEKLWGKSGHFIETIDGRTYHIYHKYIETIQQYDMPSVAARLKGDSHRSSREETKEGKKDGKGMKERSNRQGYMAVYYSDISDIEKIRRKAEESQPVFAYIQLDNIDDVTKGLSEINHTNLWAEVNTVILEEIDEADGFIRSYSDESYIACFSRKALEDMIQNNFPLLDKVRKIPTARRIPLTISMGIATEEPTMRELAERARAGLDLALGRGGDQASVYKGAEVKFYGGLTSGSEKNTRVRARVVAQAIKELINDAENVVIMGHEREDYDSIGGAIGMSTLAKADQIPVNVVLSNQTNAIDNFRDIILEREDMAGLLISADEAEEYVNDNTLVIVVDVHRPDMVAAPKALAKAKKRIVIDHHRRSTEFIEKPLITYLEPSSSSTSELVTELIQYYGEHVSINDVAASVLYAGIVVDTKNFIVQTGSRTFDAASFLRRSGANLDTVRKLFQETFETTKCRADIISHAERHKDLALAVCPKDTENASVVCAQTADMLITVEGVEASFVFYTREDGGIGVSARSQGVYNVQVIMEALGGGGHRTVAGGQLKDMTIDEAKVAVLEAAEAYKEKLNANKEEEK